MINIQGLNKTYESGTHAVKNLQLQVADGEILALLGPNGAGKSTTIRILTTLSGFDDGKVDVAGHDVDRDPTLVRQAIGYVAQETGVDYFLTGRENMMLQGRMYRMTKNDIQKRIAELAEYFELTEHLDKQVAGYSGGMRRKLDIATALIHRPKVLFLDEPTLGLDTKSRQSLWRYIRMLNEEIGLTILLTTHYLEEADKLAHRVAIIDQGQIKVIDTPEVLKTNIHGDVVSMEFEDESKEMQSFTWQLREHDFIKDSTWESDKFHIYVTNGAEAIPKVMQLATESHITVRNISFSRPTLDDVFIKYTGSSLQSDKEDGGEEWWHKWAGKGGGSGKWAKQWQESQDQGDKTEDSAWWKADQNSTEQPAAPTSEGQDDWKKWQASDEADTTGTEQKTNWPESQSGNNDWQKWQQNSGDQDHSAENTDNASTKQQWPNQGNWNKDKE